MLWRCERCHPSCRTSFVAAIAGAGIGTRMGIAWMSVRALQRVLAIVLLVAGVKFLVA
jgi:hypothetical protein